MCVYPDEYILHIVLMINTNYVHINLLLKFDTIDCTNNTAICTKILRVIFKKKYKFFILLLQLINTGFFYCC